MKKAILLLHGFATDKTDFDPIIPYLEKMYDHIEINNLPGHDVLQLKGFTKTRTIHFVIDQMKKLQKEYEIVDVMGFSMGGALATYLASHFKVRNLVLLAPAVLYINANYPIARFKKFFEYLKAKYFDNQDENNQEKIEEFNQRMLEDQEVIKITKQYILPNYNLRTIKEFRDIIKFCKDNIGPIEAQTLVIMGDIDQLVPETADEYLSNYCKYKISITMKNVSHMMLRSKEKDKIIKEVINFLS